MAVFAWAERHPRAFLAISFVPAFVLGAFAWQQWWRAQSLGSEPARVAAAQAIERADRSGESYVELSDSRTDCETSVVFGSGIYARVAGASLADETPLIASSEQIPCRANEPLIGVVKPLNARLYKNLSKAGLSLPGDRPVWLLSRHDGPANARLGSWVLLALATVIVLLGCSGFAVRRSNRQTPAARAESAHPREALLTSLSRPPLSLRGGFVAATLGTGMLIGVCASLFAGLAVLGAREVYEAQIEEPRRWRNAEQFVPAGRVTVLGEGQLAFSEALAARVQVSWLPAGAVDPEPVRVEYHVAGFSGLKQPIVIRQDESGYLTSAGFELAPARTVLWVLASALGLSILVALIWSSKSFFERIRCLWRARRRPRLMFMPLLEVKEVHQYGMHTASTWTFGDSPARKHQQTWPARRTPHFDESGKRLLVIVPDEPDPKAPTLIGSDGYPFVI